MEANTDGAVTTKKKPTRKASTAPRKPKAPSVYALVSVGPVIDKGADMAALMALMGKQEAGTYALVLASRLFKVAVPTEKTVAPVTL